jgi:K+-sensing histidine kinase KdpD
MTSRVVRFSHRWLSRLVRTGGLPTGLVSSGTTLAALLLALTLAPIVSNAALCLFLGAVMLSAWWGQLRAGLVTTILSVACLSYFFEEPSFSPAIESADTLVDLVVFGLVAWLISSLSANLHDARSRAEFAHADADAARGVAEEAVRARDTLLGSVAHDLRSPLTVIRDQADLLRVRLVRVQEPEREAWIYRLEAIAMTVDRMESAIDELLDVARPRNGVALPVRPAPVELASLVRKVIEAHRAHDPSASVDLRLRGVPIIGVWDERRLERVLENLVGSALESSPDHGRVQVDVERHDDADDIPWAVVRVKNAGAGGAACVPGRGLATTTAQRGHGIGIGLTDARQIVEQHGGRLHVERTTGRGSTFILILPLDATAPVTPVNVARGSHAVEVPLLAGG